ncbi:MAG: glycosyltransferase N-terminal domain-containing protein, partial [Gemmatimonadota bacterium]
MQPSSSYRALAGLAGALIPLAARWSPRLSQGHVGRRRSLAGFLEWARSSRDRSRPLIWWHAPSVGEGRQAEAVLVRVRERRPAWQLAFTHFSPSAEQLAASLPVDVAGYLPWDTPGPVEQLVAALQPTALVFAKLDLWPELAGQAAASGAAVAMVAATVSRRSGRTRWPTRQLTRSGYRTVAAAGAIATEDAERLARLGIRPDRIQVTGDPRADSVADRVARVDRGDPLLALGSPETLVAGSTWPEDEDVLLGALARLRATGHPGARLILAPHQPSPEHLRRVEAQARRAGLTIHRLGAMTPNAWGLPGDAWPDVILVDRVG